MDGIPQDVVVTDPAAVAVAWGRTLPRPRVISASPSKVSAGTTVQIQGLNFRAVGAPTNAFVAGNGLTVRIGGLAATVTGATATTLTVVTPRLATTGAVAIVIVNADGTTTRNAGALVYG
jgi:hypothetical protein